MSKASAMASARVKDLHVDMVGAAYSCMFHLDPKGRLCIDNLGPFTRPNALKIARWILDTFGAPIP